MAMLGTESVLARIRDLAHGQSNQEDLARMSLVENTAEAVAAEFARRPFDGPWLQVVVRDLPPITRPNGRQLRRPPTAILKQGPRPLAMLHGELLIVSRTAPRCVRMPLIREARERILDYELVQDSQLVKLVE